MPDTVCCPKCWTWDELGKRSTCKRCGTPLILADGRTVAEATAGGAAPLMPAVAGTGAAFPMATVARRGVDWVEVARLITIGYGALLAIALIVIGLLFRHLTVPLTDPSTGATTYRAIDMGPAFAIAAIFIAAIFAFGAWLTRFTVVRVIFLLLDGLGIVGLLSNAARGQRGSFGLLSAFDLVVDLGYAAVLVMSLMTPGPDARTRG